MKYSVIIPAFNVELYLEKCVRSVLDQTSRDFELIIVDDGSTDGTPAICDKLAADERVRVVHRENGGVNSARRQAAETARGEYIVCVDADDCADRTLLENFDGFDADIVCCGYRRGEKSSMPGAPGFYDRARMEKEIFPSLIESERAECFSPHLWAKAIKSDIFRAAVDNVDDRIKIGEDGAAVAQCVYMAKSLAITSTADYFYTDRPDSAVSKKHRRNFEEARLIAESVARGVDIDAFDFSAQSDRLITHVLFNTCAVNLAAGADRREVKEVLGEPFYAQAVKRAEFKGIKPKLMKFALESRLLSLIARHGAK